MQEPKINSPNVVPACNHFERGEKGYVHEIGPTICPLGVFPQCYRTVWLKFANSPLKSGAVLLGFSQ